MCWNYCLNNLLGVLLKDVSEVNIGCVLLSKESRSRFGIPTSYKNNKLRPGLTKTGAQPTQLPEMVKKIGPKIGPEKIGAGNTSRVQKERPGGQKNGPKKNHGAFSAPKKSGAKSW